MASSLQSLGKVVVASAGTPKQVVDGQPAGSLVRWTVHSFLIEALPTNTGKLYIGLKSAMDRTTLAHCIAILPIPTANLIPSYSATISLSPNALNLSDLWLDVDVSGDGALVSALTS